MLTNINLKLTQDYRDVVVRSFLLCIGMNMPDNAELISRLVSLRKTMTNIKEITGLIGLQTQVSLLEDDHNELRSKWVALALELSQMSALADSLLNKFDQTKVAKGLIYVSGVSAGPEAGVKAKIKRGSARRKTLNDLSAPH
jgi:hypothetical protein